MKHVNRFSEGCSARNHPRRMVVARLSGQEEVGGDQIDVIVAGV